MTVVNRSSNAKIAVGKTQVGAGLFAGEALTAVAPCYIASDGTVKMSGSAISTNHQTTIVGWTPEAYDSGDPVSLFVGPGLRFSYSAGMTPGTNLYVSSGSVNGWLATTGMNFTLTAVSGSSLITDAPAAIAVTATDIITLR